MKIRSQTDLTDGLTDKYVSAVIQYLDPDFMRKGADGTTESENPVSIVMAILLLIAVILAFGILIARV